MLLSLQHIAKRFCGISVLLDVSCSFRDGCRYALVGANGSGKTTILNIVSGFIRADSGQATFNGRSISGRPAVQHARNGIARTFQSVKLFRSLSVFDNLLIALRDKPDEVLLGALIGRPAQLTDRWRNRISAVLTEYNLQNYSDHLAGELSYGQQKLLHYAMATVNPFELLLLDEPVAGLQPNSIDEMLVRLKAIDKAVVVVEHNMDFIRELDAEVLFLAEGRIIAQGTLDEVMSEQRVRESYL